MKQLKHFGLLILFITLFSYAKAGDNGNHYGQDKNGNNGNHYGQNKDSKGGGRVPIDGGLSLLLIAGAGYGIKKVSGRKKSISTQL